MSRSKRTVAIIVVGTGAFVACLTVGPNLSSTEQTAVVLQQQSFTFPPTTVGSDSPVQTLVIQAASGSGASSDCVVLSPCTSGFNVVPDPSNVSCGSGGFLVARTCGAGSGTGGSGTGTAGSAIPTFDLAGDMSCPDPVTTQDARFNMTFHPTLQGPSSCQITVSGASNMVPPVFLSGMGIAPPNAIAVTPSQFVFGDVHVGAQDIQQLTLQNVGSGPLNIGTIAVQPITGAGISVPANTAHMLAAGTSEMFGVKCAPGVAGGITATLSFTHSAANVPSPVQIPVSCRGTDSLLAYNVSPKDATTRVGEPANLLVTVSNGGGAVAPIEKYELVMQETGQASSELTFTTGVGQTPPFPLGSGANATINVKYAASVARPQGPIGTLTVTHDGGKTDQVVINGSAKTTALGLDPDGHDFKAVCSMSTQTIDVAVFAAAEGDFQVSDVAATPPFTFVPKAGTTIPGTALGNHGNDLMFSAKVAPTAPGPVMGTVTLKTNIPGALDRKVMFQVDSLAAGLGVTEDVDFGSLNGIQTTPGKSVQLTNCSPDAVMVMEAHVEGANGGEFAIVSPDPAALVRSLAQAEQMELLVTLAARTPGAKVASLVITTSAGAKIVPLHGFVAGGADGGGRRETYYACDCSGGGGASGVAPIGLAFLVIVRRRRK